MTRTELVKILTFISNAYPQKFEYPRGTKEETKFFTETWYSFLQDYDYQLVRVAVKKIIINMPAWPPAVGELVEEIEALQAPAEEKITGGEAWQLALEAVRKYGFYEPARAMNSLPPLVQKAVECYGGFEAVCHSEINNAFARQNFIRIYEELAAREKRKEMLPPSIKKEIRAITDRFKDSRTQFLEAGDRHEEKNVLIDRSWL